MVREFHEVARRRTQTRKERMTPCSCCEWPLSQRHHLLNVATYGENAATIQLCANCHELYHLMYNHYVLGSDGQLLGRVMLRLGLQSPTITKLYQLVMDAKELEKRTDMLVMEMVMR